MSGEKDLLSTHNSLLTKWTIGGSGTTLLSATSLLTSGVGTKFKREDDRKRKSVLDPCSITDQKKMKDDQVRSCLVSNKLLQGELLKSGPILTSSRLSMSSLSPSLSKPCLSSNLLTSGSAGISSTSILDHHQKLESPLSQVSLQKSKSVPVSRPLEIATSLVSKPLHASGVGPEGSNFNTDITPKPRKVMIDIDNAPSGHSKAVPTVVRDKGQSEIKRSKKNFSKHEEAIISRSFDIVDMPLPEYHLRTNEVDTVEMEIPHFVHPSKDAMLVTTLTRTVQDVSALKNGLINAVSASLLCSPNFKDPNDPSRQQLIAMSENIVNYDPEFILKLAVYSRKELNIRTTSNFLLALSSNRPECRPYLMKYFSTSIALPSDWIEVAEIYQAFKDDNLKFGSLPSSLRRVMIAKFVDFDKYQLAKYNKEKSRLKKNKKKKDENNKEADSDKKSTRGGRGERGRGRGRGGVVPLGTKRRRDVSESSCDDEVDSEEDSGTVKQVAGVEYDEESETEEERQLKTFTLKQLIRKLHITEPVEHVMCLIGKKYPLTREEFYQHRLPGVWEEERAGKRMKLPIPETWETQVSLKGNKPETWQSLLDNKKLPFMAMLRNLRNLIKAGISNKHHNMVIRRLTDQKQVINSKQFPFRFFSAYEVLTELQNEYTKSQAAIVEAATRNSATGPYSGGVGVGVAARGGTGRGGRGKTSGRGGRGGKGKDGAVLWWLKKQQKKRKENSSLLSMETPYDEALIQRYRKALDTSVKIATVYNVEPIRGRTIIICSQDEKMKNSATAARGIGKSFNTAASSSLLLALMCKYSCEESELILHDDKTCLTAEVDKGTILDNVYRLSQHFPTAEWPKTKNMSWDEKKRKQLVCGFPYWVVGEKLRDRIQIDNLIVLGFGLEPTQPAGSMIGDFLKQYRHLVNPNLLYVSICATGKGCQFNPSIKAEHENDIYISGFSDAILRFIAERGSGGQLLHVENIDQAYDLTGPTPITLESVEKHPKMESPEQPLPVSSLVPRWRTARVFISSTFRDMHGERDLLTRFVFPELRALGKHHFINVYEVDLRWGVKEEVSNSNKTLEVCLQELTRCQLFLGLLGERYGWVPASYQVPDTEEFDCVRQYSPGSSVTELEMHFGALRDVQKNKEKGFFFIRDNSFEKDIPLGFKPDFVSESEESKTRMNKLKARVRSSGLEVFDNYPCQWGGVVDNKPMVAGLEEFGQRALNNLWLAVQRLYPDEDALLDEDTHITRLHRAFVDNQHSQFVGRDTLIKNCIKKIVSTHSGIIGLVGKSGSGKSSLMAKVLQEYVVSKYCASSIGVLVHIVGAAPGSTNLAATLRRLCHEMNRNFCLNLPIPEDFKNLVLMFGRMLLDVGNSNKGSPIVLFMDGLYLMEDAYQPSNLEWLPQPLPPNVVIVLSAVEEDACHQSLVRLKVDIISVGALDMFDKAEVVRKALAAHHKALEESAFNNQLRFLMQKKDAHNPLFLKMACEELRVFGVFEKVTSKLKSMSHTTQQLLQEVLQRLETDHDIDLVSTALSFLLCTREGLLAEELHELLAWHTWVKVSKLKVEPFDMVKSRFPSQHFLPPAVFAFLLRSMQSFLNPLQSFSGNICLTLAHPEIRAAIQHRYLRGAASDRELQLHLLLAGYFLRQADPNGDGSWKGHSRRAFSELPFHLSAAGCFKDLGSILGSLLFIHAKCMLGLASTLMEDFAAKVGSNKKTLEKQRLKFLDSPVFSFLKEYHEFVSNNLHILASHPALMWQQASNSPQNSLVYTQLTQLKTAGLVSVKDYMDWRNRPQYPNPCYLHLTNLDKPVTCVAVSPDNSYFATGSLDCIVHLYNLATGKEIRFYRGHSDAIADVCFINQTVLCSASLDSTLSLWSVKNGHRIALLKGHTRRVNACAAGPTGKVVASASWDCSVKIWNATSGEIICSFNLESPVNDVDFHPDGQLIVTASWDTTIKIFDILHQTRKAVLRGHTSSVRSVTYSNDGCHIASASLEGDVKIWSASKGIQVGNIRGHGAPINKLIFSPTGRELITASDDHKIKIWSGNLGTPLHVLGCEEDGPATAVSLSKDCATVAVGYHSSVVRVFDVTAGLQLFEAKPHTLPVRAIIYSNDSNYILSGSDDTKVFVLESTQGTRVCSMEAHTKPVLGITVHSKFVATTSEDCTCCLYPPIKVAKQTRIVKPLSVLRAHTAPVTSCTFRPDGLKLATSSRDMSVLIWDTTVCQMDPNPTPEIVMDQCHADWVNACCWSNTVDFLMTASSDFNLKVWDLGTKQEKYKLTGHTSSVNAMAYKYGCVVSGSSDGQVKVWNHRGTEITTLYGHSQRVNGCDVFVKCRFADGYNLLAEEDAQKADEEEKEMTWAEETEYNEWAEKNAAILKEAESPKKKKAVLNVQDVVVATCSDDGTVRLWRPLEANTLACLMGHSDRVVAVAADKDGHIVSSSFDHSLRMWTPELVKESYSTAARMGHIAEVTSFSTGTADCNLLLSSDRSGEVKIWQYSSTVECIYTFKAHEKSVNAVCFVNKSCTRFVTASDDMTMALWEILHKKHGVIIRKKKERGLDSPVSSVTWDSTLQSGNSFVFASMWDGQVLYWNIDTNCSHTKTVCKVLDYQQCQKTIEAYHHWPLSVNIVNQQLVATATDGHLYILTLKQKQDEIEIAEHKTFLIPTNQVDTTVLADTLSSLHNWVYTSCASQTGNSLYIGDSLGQLSHCFFSSDNMRQLKVHAGAIRCVVVEGDFVFTSSVDCTIKVWTHKFQQRGQFYCLAPVTSMCLVRTADTSGLHLIAGDSLGNIYHLVWHH